MAMFQDYKGGGIRPVTGVIEAGANIGKMYQEGLSKLGEGIGEGIKQYNKRKEEDKLLTAKAEAEAKNLKFLYDQIKDNPELAPFAKSFEPHIANIGKFADMDRSGKQEAVLSAEAFNKSIAPSLALYKEGLDVQTKQGIEASKVDAKKFGKTPDIQNITLAIKTPFDPNKDYATQRAAAGAEVSKFFAANPDITNTDKEAYLTAWHDLWRSKINNATPQQMNPDTKAKAIKQFDSYTPYNENQMTDEESGVTDYSKEADLYNAINTSAVQAKYDALKPETARTTALDNPEAVMPTARQEEAATAEKVYLTGKEKYTAEKTKLEKQVKDLEEESKTFDDKATAFAKTTSGVLDEHQGKQFSWLLKKKEEADAKAILAKKSLESLDESKFTSDEVPIEVQAAKGLTEENKLRSAVEIKTKELEKEKLEGLLADLKRGSYVALADRMGEHAVFGATSLTDKILHDPISKTADQKTLWEAVDKFSEPRRKDLFEFLGKVRDVQGVGVFDNSTTDLKPQNRLAAQRMIEERIAGLEKEIKTAPAPKVVTTAEASAEANRIAGKPAEQTQTHPTAEPVLEPERDAQGFSTMGIKVGEKVTPRELTWQEKKQEMRDWFIQTKQYVPSNFDKIFNERYPESKLAVAKTEVGDMWYDGDKWHLVPAKQTKPLTDKQISEHSLYNYGVVNQQTGRIEPEERIPNSGILTMGFVKGGEKKAEAFDNLVNDTAKIREYVPRLLAMFDKAGHSIPQQNHGEAEIMMTELKAAIRVKTVGTGPVALPEHAMIAKQIGDPTAFFAWDKVSKQKLETLLSTAETALKNNSAGVRVELRPAGKSSDKLAEQAKLDIKLANRKNITN